LTVKYRVRVSVRDLEVWSDICNKIGEDMILQDYCLVEHKHLKPGDECIEAYHETQGIEEHSRLLKRDFEQLKLPVILKFTVDLRVAQEWRPDMVSLQYKFDALNTVYSTNLLGGFSSMSGARADPWNPMARLAVNALNKVLARYPDIRSVLDIGCGDMAWMQYFLKEHQMLTYVGVDIVPFCLAINFRRFPKMQFLQTDLSNLSGIEIMPQGCDLVVAKDVFNHMTLPDAVNAVRRIVNLRPRFLLTHVHTACDNSGWERRIDKHLHYTRYDYNKSPFSLPFPVVEIQRISEEAVFVLYEISPEGNVPPPPRIERMELPSSNNTDAFSLVTDGELVEAGQPQVAQVNNETSEPTKAADELGPQPVIATEKLRLTTAVTDLPDKEVDSKPAPERKPIKGIPAVEFRARCDLIFEKYDKDTDGVLNFEELANLMDAGGRRIEEYDAYASLCTRLGCDARVGLTKKDVYKLFEKAPQAVWEEVYRSINPLAQMVKKGAEKLPESFLERSLPNFLFEDEEQFAKVYIELNAHLYYGAAEVVTEDHIQAFFGKQRMEVHIAAPGSYGAQDLYIWKLIFTPLTDAVVPEDCTLQLKETTGRFGSKKITIKLMKSKKKKWYKVGQAATGQRV
jgi:SAM-dependent methyltransferase